MAPGWPACSSGPSGGPTGGKTIPASAPHLGDLTLGVGILKTALKTAWWGEGSAAGGTRSLALPRDASWAPKCCDVTMTLRSCQVPARHAGPSCQLGTDANQKPAALGSVASATQLAARGLHREGLGCGAGWPLK